MSKEFSVGDIVQLNLEGLISVGEELFKQCHLKNYTILDREMGPVNLYIYKLDIPDALFSKIKNSIDRGWSGFWSTNYLKRIEQPVAPKWPAYRQLQKEDFWDLDLDD